MMWFLPHRRPSDGDLVKTIREDQAVPSDGTSMPDTSPASASVSAPGVLSDEDSQAFFITLIFFAALTLRVLLFVLGPLGDNTRAMYPDSYRYVELGQNLAETGSFGLSSPEVGVVHEPLYELRKELGQLEPVNADGLRPEIMRTPGYPAFIGALAWLGLGINGLLLIQCLFSASSVALVYGIGRSLLGRPGPALVAAAIVALHPADIAAPTAVLTETCFTLLVLLGLWSVADRERRGIGSASFGGLMIGLSALVRPVSVFLGPAVALWMLVTDRRLKTLVLAVLMMALSLAPPLTWMARNQAVGFGYRLSSIPYINTYFYGNAYMRITEAGGDWKTDWPATVNTLMAELRQAQAERPDANVFDTMKDLGIQAIREKPALYASVLKESMIKLFTDHSMGGLYQQLGLTYTPTGLRDKLMAEGLSWSSVMDALKNPTGWLALVWVGWNGVLLVGMILGSIMLLIRRRFAAFLLLGGVLFYFAFATQTTGLERFRLPILGIQALLVMSLFAPRLPRSVSGKRPKRRWYEIDDEEELDSTSDSMTDDKTSSAGPTPEQQSLRPI